MKKIHGLFISIIMIILYPTISLSAVNLPWSTTYNCPEWKQTDGNPNCDGLTEYGAWTTNDGKEEQITSVANYPGGTGRGQRHWLGDGYTVNSGGTRIEFTSPQSELWIRWYMRFQNGFQWNPLSEFKILYLDVAFTSRVIVGYRSWDRLGIVANGYSYDSPSGNGWNTIMANGGTDANGNKTSDGQWHMYEIHLKMDTNGSNGIIEWWVDGVKRSSRSDVNYQTQGGWSTIVIGSNSIFPANGSSSAYYVDYDDIRISGIASISGGSNSSSGGDGSSDTSISGGGCGFVKDISGKGQGAKGKGLSMVVPFLLLILLMLRKRKIRSGRSL